MNTDEKFNYYSELMFVKHGELAAKRLETAMSQMLELKMTEQLIWNYATRCIEEPT
jgi:hypothetical protein